MGEQRILSVDPGSVHNGTVLWYGAQCAGIKEHTPESLFAWVESLLRTQAIDVVVCEEYRLYPWLLAEQGFSQVKTVEVIGVLRYLCSRWSLGVAFVEQSATIKRVARAQAEARKSNAWEAAKEHGVHCMDAYLHGFFFVNRSINIRSNKEES